MNSVLLGLILSACIVFSATTDTSDYSCDEAGYLNYLSAWTVTEKTTSRDASSAEFKQRLEYFIDSCEKIHEWNLRNKYHMEFTFYADWHADEFDVMTVTEQRYTGMKPNIPSTTPVLNNSNWRHLLPLTNPCDDVFDGQDNMLYEAIGRPQNCSVSWAFAITDSIEFAIKKLYLETYDQVVDVALSAQELIDCVAKDHGIQGNSCTAVPLVWGFDYVFENGIAYRQFYPHTNVEADTCTMVEENQKYHIAGYEKPHVYNKLGLFEMLLKGPTAVALGLDPEYFQYYRSDAEEGPFFSTAYWRPSVYGVVVEYKQYAVDGESELAQWPFFAVETRLRACDSFIFRLPILESTGDGNVAGIAGFAIRPIVNELISSATEAPTTVAPTVAPTTVAPTTVAPTEAPTTVAPTVAPTTVAPTTEAPTTQAPVVPTTEAPAVPTTVAPTTQAPVGPTTQAPVVPTTEAPVAPTTEAPVAPTTEAPVVPTTEAPAVPTTVAPTTEAPVVPTTEAPAVPTTVAPTTDATTAAPTLPPTPFPTREPMPTIELPTTKAPTEAPTTQAPVVPTTEAPAVPTTEAPAVPTTEAPAVPTTEAPVQPTTQAPVVPTTEAPVAPTTEAPAVPTTVAPVVPTTEAPAVPTTEAPAVPTTEAPVQPTSEPTVQPTMFIPPTTEAPVVPTTEAPVQPTMEVINTVYVNETAYPTLDMIPRDADVLIFASNSYANLVEVNLSGFTKLQSIVFEAGSFTNTHSVSIESATVTKVTFRSKTFYGDSLDGSLTLHTPLLEEVIFDSDALHFVHSIHLRGFSAPIQYYVYNGALANVETIYYMNTFSGYAQAMADAIYASGHAEIINIHEETATSSP